MTSYDVVIVGAGVAGCACALSLADSPMSIAVVERQNGHAEGADYGETLPPESVRLLTRLGLMGASESFAVPFHGIQSAWGTPSVETRSFSSSLPPFGLRIDKGKLVRTMRAHLAGTGAHVRFGMGVRSVDRAPTGGDVCHALVLRSSDGAEAHVCARLLVDASGRRRVITRRFTEIHHFDRLVASVGTIHGPSPALPGLSASMGLVESTRSGWWYTAPRRSEGRVAIRFSDPPRSNASWSSAVGPFWSDLQRTRFVSRFFDKSPADYAVRVSMAAAGSTKARRAAGLGWVAIGDAARTVDPLSSNGMYNGLKDGIDVAATIAGTRADPDAFADWSERLDDDFEAYLDRRDAFYGLERRWRDEHFWSLRRP